MPRDNTDDVMKELEDALNKSVDTLVAEATEALDEAKKADVAFGEAITKAGMPENFQQKRASKKPALGSTDDIADKDKGGDAGGGTDPDNDNDEDCEKAITMADLAKAAHEVVVAYIDVVADQFTKAEEVPDRWKKFAEDAAKYYSEVNTSIAKRVEEYRKKATEHSATITKADDPKKADVEAQAAELTKIADTLDGAATLAKGFAEKMILPRQEKKLAEPMKLDYAIDLGKGEDWMPVQTLSELQAQVAKHKQVSIDDQPMVTAHLFNAAKALNTKLTDVIGWKAPTTIERETARSTASDATARVSDITEADKAAAMKKGLTIIGPTSSLLSTMRAISASPMLERFLQTSPKAKDLHDGVKKWLGEGDALLKSLISAEADAIWMLDLPTFPQEIIKADHWAKVAGAVVVETISDDMPVEQRQLRKELGSRLVAAVDVFKKAEGGDDLGEADAKTLAETTEKLTKAEAALSELQAKHDKFTGQLPALIRKAKEQGDAVKKAEAALAAANEELVKLRNEPMPSKGRVGAGGKIEKSADGEGGSGAAETSAERLAKASTLSGGAREQELLKLAHRMRAEEEQD